MTKSTFTDRSYRLRKLLRDARKAAGLSQVELSLKLGRPQSYVSKFERGERRLDVVEFLEVTDAVGLDPHKIIRSLR